MKASPALCFEFQGAKAHTHSHPSDTHKQCVALISLFLVLPFDCTGMHRPELLMVKSAQELQVSGETLVFNVISLLPPCSLLDKYLLRE